MDISKTLADKLATLLNYLSERRADRVRKNPEMLASLLDDPEVANWLDGMSKQNRVDFTRFS